LHKNVNTLLFILILVVLCQRLLLVVLSSAVGWTTGIWPVKAFSRQTCIPFHVPFTVLGQSSSTAVKIAPVIILKGFLRDVAQLRVTVEKR